MTRAIDIRVNRTKSLLKQSLIGLMQTTHGKNISVQQLTASAKISRVTFYRHYQGMPDFLLQTIDDALQGLFLELDIYVFLRRERTVEYYTAIFDHVKDNSDLFTVMLGPNGLAEFRQRFTQMRRKYHKKMMDNYKSEFHSSAKDDILYAYFASVLIGLIEYWLSDEGSKYSSQEMAEQLFNIAHKQVLKRVEN